MRNRGRIDRKMGDKLDWSSETHMNQIISQLRKIKWRNEWRSDDEWTNERMSDGQIDGWNNLKWTNDVTWLNDSNQ